MANTNTASNYKQQMLETVRAQMSAVGGELKVEGSGRGRHVRLVSAVGQESVVYFPTGSSLHGIDVDDLRDAVKRMTVA